MKITEASAVLEEMEEMRETMLNTKSRGYEHLKDYGLMLELRERLKTCDLSEENKINEIMSVTRDLLSCYLETNDSTQSERPEMESVEVASV